MQTPSTSGGVWRSAGWRAYALAFAATGVAVAATGILAPSFEHDLPYTPLVGTVVLISVFCGPGPALASVAFAWAVAPLLLSEPRWTLGTAADISRWAIGLAVALILIWASWLVQRLRERESELRGGLDRIARLAPRVADEPPEMVAQAVCQEARALFGADVAQLWKVREGRVEAIWREPPLDSTPPGHVAEPRDYPGMQRALERLETTFIPDARTVADGAALERVQREGVRSVLRVPVVVAGRAEMLLALRWARVIPEPSPQTRALARRFADHAGLVMEQAERRLAQRTERSARARAERLAGDLAQLHAIGTSLGAAVDAREIASLVAERVLVLSGAEAAFVFDVSHGREVRLLAESTSDGALARGREDASVRAPSGPEAVPREPAWELAESGASGRIPLLVEGRAIGLLLVEFAEGRAPDEAARRLVETIAGYAAPPLERARLHEREHAARVRAELSARRTRRLQALTAAFAGALTPAEVATTFLDETAEAAGAGAAALWVLDVEQRELRAVGSLDFPAELLGPEGILPVTDDGPAPSALRAQEPVYHDLEAFVAAYPLLAEPIRRDELGSYAFLPVTAGAAPIGVAAFAWKNFRRLDDDERAFLEGVVAQCGLALDRAQRYEGERIVAETLQRSVLPESLPAMEGVRVSAVYLPGSTAVDVGGDWFDTLTLPDGRLGFVVGDVVGKGVQAASTMGQLRNGMRALTLDASSPAATISKLNQLLENYIDVPFATLAYLALDVETQAVTLASAGHPPPLVVASGGRVSFLDTPGGLPLGVDGGAVYAEQTTLLEPGSVVVLYTDGLVERRGHSIDDGLSALARAAAQAPRTPDGFVNALVRDLLGAEERLDDVAVLAVFLDPTLLAPFELAIPAEPRSLPYMRSRLADWLDSASVSDVDARDILLATWEAGANAIEHAEAESGSLVRVEAILTGDRVRIGVADQGRWKEPEEREDRGLGLRLIESLMATVDIDRSGNGTRLVMERPLTREPARGHESNPVEH